MKRILLFFAFSLLFFSQSFAQFILKGEFRPRFEFRDGYSQLLTKEQEPAFTVSNRTRLSAYYQTGILSFGFAIQDVRVWGDDDIYSVNQIAGSKASIDLNEGWLGIKPYKYGLIKIGRQYWAYEDQRILSTRNWNQSEVKYDAFLFQHVKDEIQVDAGMSWYNNAEKAFNDVYPDDKLKSQNFIYLKKEMNDWLNISLMAFATGFRATDTTTDMNWQGTYGVYFNIKKEAFTAMANGFYQSGRSRFGGNKTNAYMFSVKGDYLIKSKFSVGAQLDYLSGRNAKSTDSDYLEKDHSFDVFYGTTHGFFGHMDLFTDLRKSTKDGGIIDAYLKLKYNLKENTSIGGDLHFFSLQNNVAYQSGETQDYYDKGLGQEVDLYASWDLNKIFNIKGGYSFYVATATMEKIQGVYDNARFPNWAWVMITAKPVFIDTTEKDKK
jgi:hypothetical protein